MRLQIFQLLRLAAAWTVLLGPVLAHADPVAVRYLQGSSHIYLGLKTLQGKLIATGEAVQTVQGNRVTSHLIFHFRDGSIDDDLTIFTEDRVFRLISDHHIQRGPSFPKPIDTLIDAVTGNVTSRTADGKVIEKHFDLPPDLSNGLPPNLLLSILPSVPETKVSYLTAGEKPRLIQLAIRPSETTPFTVGGLRRKATNYTIHIELGGIAGVIAPVIGKAPVDDHIWIQSGAPPAFIREEGQLYEGGPVWRIEVITPRF